MSQFEVTYQEQTLSCLKFSNAQDLEHLDPETYGKVADWVFKKSDPVLSAVCADTSGTVIWER